MSITDPNSLNRYESFSSTTYGETNYKQMRTIIEELEKMGKWKKNEVFVDLGSGIGSIVMQAAACSPGNARLGFKKFRINSRRLC